MCLLLLALLQANAESHVEIQISDDSRHAHFDFHRFVLEHESCLSLIAHARSLLHGTSVRAVLTVCILLTAKFAF